MAANKFMRRKRLPFSSTFWRLRSQTTAISYPELENCIKCGSKIHLRFGALIRSGALDWNLFSHVKLYFFALKNQSKYGLWFSTVVGTKLHQSFQLLNTDWTYSTERAGGTSIYWLSTLLMLHRICDRMRRELRNKPLAANLLRIRDCVSQGNNIDCYRN